MELADTAERAALRSHALDVIIAAHAVQSERVMLSGEAIARLADLPGVTADRP